VQFWTSDEIAHIGGGGHLAHGNVSPLYANRLATLGTS